MKRLASLVLLCLARVSANAFDDDCYRPIVQADIPCYYFRMDALSGTTQNGAGFFGSTDNMTIINAPTLNATGIPGANPNPATIFNGSTQYEVDAGGSAQDCQGTAAGPARPCDSGSPHDFTGEGWAKPDSSWAAQGNIYARVGTGAAVGVGDFEDNLFFGPTLLLTCTQFTTGAGGNFSTVTAVTAATVNSWVYGVCQVTASPYKIQVFVNGVADASSSATSGTCQGLGPHWMVGAYGHFTDPGWPQRFFNGTLDEIATYNRVLTAREIAEHYSMGITFDSCRDWPFNVKQERHMLQAPDGITSEALRAEAFVRKITTPGICGTSITKHGLG